MARKARGRPILDVITPEAFGALVADIRAELATLTVPEAEAIRNYTRPPAAFAGRPWVATSILAATAAELTGYSRSTVIQYRRPERRHHGFPESVTPERAGHHRYLAGEVAVWAASRNPQFGPRRRQWNPPRAGGNAGHWSPGHREQAITFLAELVSANPAVQWGDCLKAAEAAGLTIRRIWLDPARARALPVILDRFAPDENGLVDLEEVAEVFRVNCVRLRGAARDGKLRAVRTPRRWLTDPSRLRFRAEKTHWEHRPREEGKLAPLPVDKDDPRALPLPGD
jgi:hypothetical protein